MNASAEQALLEDKKRLRAESRGRRDQAMQKVGAGSGQRLAFNVLSSASALGLTPGKAVSAYWPMVEEMDIKPLMTALDACGMRLGLPVVIKKATPLVFRAWKPGDVLHSAAFGLSEPGPECPEITPDVMLAPLLAFDAGGRRIGWGGGFYDRTIAKIRAAGRVAVVGIAFSGQEIDRVPTGEYDQLIDWVATEKGVRKLG